MREERRSDAVSAIALCAVVVIAWSYERSAPQPTPIDAALPVVALILAFVAWLVRESAAFYAVACAVPVLIGVSIAAPDERTRLVAFGLIAAAAFGGALYGVEWMSSARAAGFALAAVAIIRWIARERVEQRRELLIAIGCVLITLACRGRNLGIALAVLAALVTPAIPVRTVAIPYIAAFVCWIAFIARSVQRVASRDSEERVEEPARRSLLAVRSPSVVVEAVSTIVIAAVVLTFPWSGVAARALPTFWRAQPAGERIPLNWALVPGQSVWLDLPSGADALVVSGANALDFRGGRVIGRIDPGATPIRIGEVADWGYARRDQFWKSHNSLPKNPAGSIRDYGYDAWIDGAGRVPLPAGVVRIRITAERSLPADARLQVEAIEVARK